MGLLLSLVVGIVVHRSATARPIDLDRVRVQAGNPCQIGSVQNRAVLAVVRPMRQRHETGVAVRNVHNRAGQRQRLDDVMRILNGADMHRRNAGQHLAGDVRLHRQRNAAQVQMAAVRFGIEEGQIDTFVAVAKTMRWLSIDRWMNNEQWVYSRKVIGCTGSVGVAVVHLRQNANFVHNGLDHVSEQQQPHKLANALESPAHSWSS